MTAKEYLRQIRTLDRVIDVKVEQRQRYMAMACGAAGGVVAVPDKGAGRGSRTERYAVMLADLEADIDADVDRLVDMRRAARAVVEGIEDARYRLILEARYFVGKDWGEIMELLGYERTRVYELHGLALEAFAKRADENGLNCVV